MMKTNYSFEIVEESEQSAYSNCIFPQCRITIHSEASLSDVLDAFQKFLYAAGYVLPPNAELGFIEN